MRGAIIATGMAVVLGIMACTSSASGPRASRAAATVVSASPGCATSSCLVGDDPAIYVSAADPPGETVPITARLTWVEDESCLLLDITSGRDTGVAVPLWPSGTAATRTSGDERGVVVPGAGRLLAGEGFTGQATWHRVDVGFLPPPSRCRHHDGYVTVTEVEPG
ncbi:hypothetical protein [Nonomuraea sp. SBT364]|uniref:hypothetical protein n=1 Tax=Nonomuraea sp. SBT364 TaxID=1580530 RepID=UPI000AB38AF5|nr:hypothetical protein [Nonomuraea sp. SBT364]